MTILRLGAVLLLLVVVPRQVPASTYSLATTPDVDGGSVAEAFGVTILGTTLTNSHPYHHELEAATAAPGSLHIHLRSTMSVLQAPDDPFVASTASVLATLTMDDIIFTDPGDPGATGPVPVSLNLAFAADIFPGANQSHPDSCTIDVTVSIAGRVQGGRYKFVHGNPAQQAERMEETRDFDQGVRFGDVQHPRWTPVVGPFDVPLNQPVTLALTLTVANHIVESRRLGSPGTSGAFAAKLFTKTTFALDTPAFSVPAGITVNVARRDLQVDDLTVLAANAGGVVAGSPQTLSAVVSNQGLQDLPANDYSVTFDLPDAEPAPAACGAAPLPTSVAAPAPLPALRRGEQATVTANLAYPTAGAVQTRAVGSLFGDGNNANDGVVTPVDVALPAPLLCGATPSSASPGQRVTLDGNWFAALGDDTLPTVRFNTIGAEVRELVSPQQADVGVPDLGCTFGTATVFLRNAQGEARLAPGFSLAPLSDLRVVRVRGGRPIPSSEPFCGDDVQVSVEGLSPACLVRSGVHLRNHQGLHMELRGERRSEPPRAVFDVTIPGTSQRVPPGPYVLSVEPDDQRQAAVSTPITIECRAALRITDLIVGLRRQDQVVSVLGEGLDRAEGASIGGQAARFDVASEKELTVFVPDGVSGTQRLVLRGDGQSAAAEVVIDALPVVLEALETLRRTRAGIEARLTGDRFDARTIDALRIGGKAVGDAKLVSPREIVVVIPADRVDAKGMVTVAVLGASGEVSRDFVVSR